jgi:hypothetical protein
MKSLNRLLPCLLLTLSTSVFALGVSDFTENIDRKSKASDEYLQLKEKSRRNFKIEGSIKNLFRSFASTIEVPGFVSARDLGNTATIVGPIRPQLNFGLGDTIYLRWTGSPAPKEGDIYAAYTPAVVLQNIEDLTDFTVIPWVDPLKRKIPKGFRLAGYLYESNAEVHITKIANAVVEAKVDKLNGFVTLNDELMAPPPRYKEIQAINAGIQQSAVVVSGVPFERISPSPNTFIYLNRGSRDGVKIGRIYQALEEVKLQDPPAIVPQTSLGEAMVVYVSDAFSTAIITKQFDVIRVGALLKTKQSKGSETEEKYKLATRPSVTPQQDLESFEKNDQRTAALPPPEEAPLPAEPSTPAPELSAVAPPLPPAPAAPAPELSAKEQKERRENILGLTKEERQRLETLDAEEQVRSTTKNLTPVDISGLEENAQAGDEGHGNAGEGDLPPLPPTPNAFAPKKPTAKNDKNQKGPKKGHRDEEELNSLMQNM